MTSIPQLLVGSAILTLGFVAGKLSELDFSRTKKKTLDRYIIMHNQFSGGRDLRYKSGIDYSQPIGPKGAIRHGFECFDENMTVHRMMTWYDASKATLEVPREKSGVLELLGFTVWVPYDVPDKNMAIKDLPEVVRCTWHPPYN